MPNNPRSMPARLAAAIKAHVAESRIPVSMHAPSPHVIRGGDHYLYDLRLSGTNTRTGQSEERYVSVRSRTTLSPNELYDTVSDPSFFDQVEGSTPLEVDGAEIVGAFTNR